MAPSHEIKCFSKIGNLSENRRGRRANRAIKEAVALRYNPTMAWGTLRKDGEPNWLFWLRWGLVAALVITFVVLSICSPNNDFLASLPGAYLIFSFAFAAVIAFLFVRLNPLPWLIAALAILLAFGFCYLQFLVSKKVFCTAMTLFAIAGFLIAGTLEMLRRVGMRGPTLSKKNLPGEILTIALIGLLPVVRFTAGIHFRLDFPFMIPTIAGAILGTGLAAYLTIKSHKESKFPKWSRVLGYSLCGLLAGTIAVWGTLTTFDVCLDFSKPEYRTCRVVGKDEQRYGGYRGVRFTIYELILADGEETISLGVPLDVYGEVEEGDYFTVACSDGLLGEAYAIYPGYL